MARAATAGGDTRDAAAEAPTCPSWLAGHLPKGHQLWFSPRRDPDAGKTQRDRNPMADGGLNRGNYILCCCGSKIAVTREAGDDAAAVTPSPEDWLAAVNTCRLALHSARRPWTLIALDRSERPIRDVPEVKTQTVSAKEGT